MSSTRSKLFEGPSDILKILLILGTIFLITTQFPRSNYASYSFDIDKPWLHDNLYAPSDFNVLKSEEQLAADERQITLQHNPTFVTNPKKKEDVLNSYRLNFESDYFSAIQDSTLFQITKSSYFQLGLELFNNVYAIGLVDTSTIGYVGNFQFINLQQDDEAKLIPLNDYFTLEDAKSYITTEVENRDGSNTAPLILVLHNFLSPNIEFANFKDEQILSQKLAKIDSIQSSIQKDRLIIGKGDLVTTEKAQVVQALNEKLKRENDTGATNLWRVIGYSLLTALLLTILIIFLGVFAQNVFESIPQLFFVLAFMALFVLFTGWILKHSAISIYVIPFCILPIIFRAFFGSRTALYAYLALIIIIGLIIPDGTKFVFLQLIAGMVAIFANAKIQYWSQFFTSIGLIFLTYCLGYFAISLIESGDIMKVDWDNYGWLAANALFILLAFPLIRLFERLFGFTSNFSLFELTDINKPLLKRLAEEAPGTFQHSLQVANLSEAAANEIGANSMLIKTAAMYHDIGKLESPIHFIENQQNLLNPHDKLPFEESAKIIINHVPYGIELAKKNKLPKIIIDFIATHHGNTRVEYFYRNFLKSYPHKTDEESKFRYPGPIPKSKEQAILMVADSVEAASKSLKEPTAEDINNLVEKIVDYKLEHAQFDDCNLSFSELQRIKSVFKKKLNSIYHVRIAYPEKKTPLLP